MPFARVCLRKIVGTRLKFEHVNVKYSKRLFIGKKISKNFMMSDNWRTYLFWFAYEHVDFRIAELESIISVYNIKFRTIKRPDDHPYWIVELPNKEVVHKIAGRAVCLRFCLELWAHSTNLEALHNELKGYPAEWLKTHMCQDKTFKIMVETFGKHFTQKEKVEKIETFSYLPLDGRINLRTPDTTLFYIEHYGLDSNNIPDTPEELFFGRWITDGQRDLIQKLSLKTRKFIGNTSMDPQLSLIMANQAQVKEGDIVLDPFVGSGSLLVAASQFGGYILGTDIDFLMLHARTRPSRITQKTRTSDESVAANMNQYGKGSLYLDVVVSDFSRPLWKSEMRVDAIITDPPYGIREATERVGSAKLHPIIDEHQAASHIPSKIEYNLPQIYKDLLNFAAKHLKIDGKLVCWFPIYRDQYSDDQLPTHPCLALAANSEQVLSNYTSRRLLTYAKTREPQETDVMSTVNIVDFREKYFALRDETRKERRQKRAEERAKNKENWERGRRESTER